MVHWDEIRKLGESNLECRCGAKFRGLGQMDYAANRLVSEKPCLGCGRTDDLHAIRSDPEAFTLD